MLHVAVLTVAERTKAEERGTERLGGSDLQRAGSRGLSAILNPHFHFFFGFPAAALPHVAAYKHSEHGNEKDKAVLVCVSHGYPLPTDWTWFKDEDGVRNVSLPKRSLGT